MTKLRIAKKVISFTISAALSAALVTSYPNSSHFTKKASAAKTLAEVQQEREERKQEIAVLQQQLDALADNKSNEEAYQRILYEQISLIRENVASLNTEIETINTDIEDTKTSIQGLELSIENKETEINTKVEDFKERLYSMYVSGDENLAAVLLGSSSFYDTMANIEMVNRVAEYDEKLIDQILEDIDALDQSKSQLESEKMELEMKVQNLEVKKTEKETELSEYDEKMAKTQAIIDQLAMEERAYNSDKARLEADIAAYDAQEKEILAAIERERQEAQRRYEEEQRRIAQEAAAKAAAEAAARNNSSNSSGNSGYSDNSGSSGYDPSTYVVPAPSAGGFVWPAPGFGYISSPYGYRWGRLHAGIDIGDAGIGGGTAVAAKSGTVVSVYNSCRDDYPKSASCGCNGGYGNCVVISHDGTYSTLYGHLRYATVSVGQYVQAGQQIGVIGCTGFSTGDHLHFEVRVNGSCQNPMNYVSR